MIKKPQKLKKAKTKKSGKKPKLASPEDILPQLTDKQLAFVAYYFENGGNATEAYSKAYNSPKGCAQSAQNLLRNPYISAFIQTRRQQLMTRWEISEDRIMQRLAAHAFTTLQDLMREDAGGYRGFRLKDWSAMDPGQAAAVKSYSESSGETNSDSITMHDPHKAIEMIIKYLNLFPNQRGSKKDDGAGRDADRKALEAALERVRKKFK